jgi:hypothetical protein
MRFSAAKTRRAGLCAALLRTVLFLLPASLFGCELVPPNNFRLISAEPAGAHPTLLHFEKGTFLETETGGVAMLAGQNAVVLFDCRGYSNRFDLLIKEGNERILYDRIGGYRPLRNGRAGTAPVGIRCNPQGKRLRGTVDVFLARSEWRDVGTSFEHYPREMRVVGYFVVPATEASGQNHPLADLIGTEDSGGGLMYPDLSVLEPPSGESRLPAITAKLPPLPLIDVQYLLPTTLLAAFRPQTP